MSGDDALEQRTRLPRRRVSRLEIVAAGIGVILAVVLVALEPDIVAAPFASSRAVLATFGGALLALVALVAMIRFGVPPIVRIVVIGLPVLATSWWLLSPYFVDNVVNDEFSTSILEQQPTSTGPGASSAPTSAATATTTATSPRLIASGAFVGLAGHDGTGDAGIFRMPDDTLVLRLENFDIENGPDLEVYLVPGERSYSPSDGSLHLGALKGNVGNQTYAIPDRSAVTQGPWTVLVWCESFGVEFVGATITVA